MTNWRFYNMRKQSKKEKDVIDKFKIDTKGMSSEQVMKYYSLSDIEKEKFVQKFREDRDKKLGINRTEIGHENDIVKIDNPNNNKKNKSSTRSSLTNKEKKKGFRTERIWQRGNDAISHECKCSNDVRNTAQYFERSNYFKNRDLLREKKEAGDKEFKINKNDRYIYHNELDKMKDKVEFEIDDNGIEIDKYKKFREAYKSMSMACLSQQTLVIVADSWDSYFEGLFGFLKGNPNYTGMPKIPGYGDKGGEYIVVIPNDRFKIISGQDIKYSWEKGEKDLCKKINTLAFEPALSYLKLDGLETTLTDKDNIRELRIVPAGIGYFIEIIYKLKEDERKKELLTKKDIDKDGNKIITEIKLNPNIVCGIDLGLRNIVTKGFVEIDTINESGKVIVNTAKAVTGAAGNCGTVLSQPIIFKGGIPKSINQYYNKRRSEIQSIYEHQAKDLKKRLRHLKFQYNIKMKNSPKNVRNQLYKEIQKVKGQLKKIRTGPALRKLEFKRKNKMEDVMHKYSRYIINDSIYNKSGTLIIGHNKGQKQSVELGNITSSPLYCIFFINL